VSSDLPIGLILCLINQFETDGLAVSLAQAPDGSLAVNLGIAEVALRHGAADGVLLDDIRVRVSGINPADLKAPGPDLLKKIAIVVDHFAVRVSRDWINGVIENGPFLKGTPINEIVLLFNDKNKNQLIVRGNAKGLPFETQILIGIRDNHVVVAVDEVRVLGFLPVPAWLRNTVADLINVARKIDRPGVTYEKQTLDIDVLTLLPIPIKLRFSRFETSGRYILVEGGDV
jgi:hypothetical protein